MKRHALVIGAALDAPADGPACEELDAERMAQMLRRRGFEVEQLARAGASRAGILAGYQRLIERVVPGDAAAIYFSGHGGMVLVSDLEVPPGERAVPRRFQFIAPTDYADSTEDDFRWISAWELSQLLARLTDRTSNVAVILDCCYASQMSRDQAVAGAVPRAIPKLSWLTLARHRDDLRARFGPLGGPGAMGNPQAVRLVACGDWQIASQTIDEQGRPVGLLTHALLATLEEIGDAPISWRALGDVVRTRVLRTLATQRPMVEGPVNRQLFSVHEVAAATIPITSEVGAGGVPVLRLGAGRLAGVSVGDIYGVTRIDAASFTEEAALARVRVERVLALHAFAQPLGPPLGPPAGQGPLPADAVAWPLQLALVRQGVRIAAPADARAAIDAAIAGSARLAVASDQQPIIGELQIAGGALRVLSRDGRELAPDTSPWSIPDAVRRLEHLAAAQALVELEGEHGLASEEIEIEWGTVHPGGAQVPRPAHWAALGLGDRIYVQVANRAAAPRFVHVFNLGLSGRITLLTGYAPTGIRLLRNEQERIGIGPDPESPAPGLPLDWPPDLERSEPGIDTLIVIVTAQAAELRVLETAAPAGARRQAHASESPLQRLCAQLHDGGMRRAARAGADAFLVARRSFVLYPLAARIAGPGFAIDEDPLALLGAARSDLWIGAAVREARDVEIRLRGLAAERAVRLDALVCTRSPDPARTWQARTIELAAGAAAEDGEVVWRGPVQDLVDIYLWIAPAPAPAPAPDAAPGAARRDRHCLAALLAEACTRPELAAAAGALVVRDPAAPWSLAGGASAALAQAAGELLREAAPETAGLLHTSFVATERYGVGHHPRAGLYHGYGVALGLSIRDTTGRDALP